MSKKNPITVIKNKTTSYLNRRPHRSFRVTRRRDYNRSLKLPGYWGFTIYVWKTLWAHRKTFILLALVYAVISALLAAALASQDAYLALTKILSTTSGGTFTGVWGEVGKAGLLFVSAATGSISQTLTGEQQVYAALIALMAWLTSVWLLRNMLAGHKVKLRDGLYNSGAPILSTFLVGILFIIQLLPLAIALLSYSALSSIGVIAAGGAPAMLFWMAAALMAVITLYLITSTTFALVIVTLPGMYPLRAIKTAGDLVIGRRLRILMRLLWMAIGLSITWTIVMIPVILIDMWLKGLWPAINWIPTVPLALLAMGSLSIIWVSSYVYLLYRKVVDDDANPA